ncbi:hypothetical protein ABTD78_21295, partial [Acinetobacter baumannii]
MFTDIWQRGSRRIRRGLLLLASLVGAFCIMSTVGSSPALACACGCSVFDVGGGLLPQEDEHGGRIFT